MSKHITDTKLAELAQIVESPKVPHTVDRTFELPTGLYMMTAGAYLGFIGLMAPLSGPQAVVGQDQLDGFILAVEMLGGKLGDQPTTVLREDDQLKPEIGSHGAAEDRRHFIGRAPAEDLRNRKCCDEGGAGHVHGQTREGIHGGGVFLLGRLWSGG